MLTHLPSRDELRAERARRHLGTFIREAWPILEPATPFVDGWYIDCLSEHLEAVSRGELRRLIVNIPPRTMKSLSTGVFWPAWDWMEHPHLRWLYASYASRLSERDSSSMRTLIKSQGGREDGTIFQRIGYQGVLRLLYDDPWSLAADQDSKTKYETTARGLRLATSVGAMATGEGGDRIVVDDPISASQAASDTERARANEWWSGTMSTRFNNARAAAVIVMQRLHEEDLTGYLLERGDWHHLCLPAEYEPSHPFVYPYKVTLPSGRVIPGDPRTEEGELLDPVRLGPEKLSELRVEQGSYGYAGQMQQRPAPDEGGMFKRHWWKRYEDEPAFERLVASWDARFGDSQEAASSYVVGQVWGIVGADRYLLAQIRARLSFTETLRAVQALDDFRRCPAKLVERKANGAAIIDSLKHQIPGLIPIEPEGGKDVRAAAVQPTVEAGNVYLPQADFIPAPAGYEPTSVEDFIEEFAVFPNGAHDDQVDAMTQALNWLANAPAVPFSTRKHPW